MMSERSQSRIGVFFLLATSSSFFIFPLTNNGPLVFPSRHKDASFFLLDNIHAHGQLSSGESRNATPVFNMIYYYAPFLLIAVH
jgi:hypothetical protein